MIKWAEFLGPFLSIHLFGRMLFSLQDVIEKDWRNISWNLTLQLCESKFCKWLHINVTGKFKVIIEFHSTLSD